MRYTDRRGWRPSLQRRGMERVQARCSGAALQQASSRHATSTGLSFRGGSRSETATTLSIDDLAQTFQLAPVSLWLEDYSGVKAVFDRWRAAGIRDNLHQIIELNNQFHSDAPVSLSIGHAMSEKGERLESVARKADFKMYEEKRRHYAETEPHRH